MWLMAPRRASRTDNLKSPPVIKRIRVSRSMVGDEALMPELPAIEAGCPDVAIGGVLPDVQI